jgi:hypothetical protein
MREKEREGERACVFPHVALQMDRFICPTEEVRLHFEYGADVEN